MKKQVISIITLLALMLGLCPVVAAEDTRTEVSTFVATTDMPTITYGTAVRTDYTFTFSVGTQANVPRSMGNWFKKSGDDWYRYDSGVFREGTYYFSNQIRIDNANGTTHKLGLTLDITVDGKKWTHDDVPGVYGTYSYVYMKSPEITVERPADFPLTFADSWKYDITGSIYANNPIPTKNFSDGVLGGTGAYTFSKVSGPEWLSVSADGVLSGTPDAAAEATQAVIRVTDEAEDYQEITISIVAVLPDPALRTAVSTFVATTNMQVPVFGATVQRVYDFTFTVGTQASVPASMGNWFKQEGDDWVRYDASSFVEGSYYYSNQLRIDGVNGTTHKLGPTLDITIDGREWTHQDVPGVYNSYSYVYMHSPVFVVEKPPIEQLFFVYDHAMDIPQSYVNVAIEPYSVATGVTGGVAPYTFSKTSGPSWLNVSADGIVSGTPDQIRYTPALATIRVTDDRGSYEEIDIMIEAVLPDPLTREKISTITAISDLAAPTLNGNVTAVGSFTLTQGDPARFAADSERGWYKKEQGEWIKYDADTFAEGEYRYQNLVCIDGSFGYDYRLDDTLTLTVDGKEWSYDPVQIETDRSYTTVYSPIYTLKKEIINPFNDVKTKDYFYEAVLWAVDRGITNGTGTTTFSPNATCTRGQIATFLWRAAGQPKPKSNRNPFNDVKEKDYYYKAVLWAVGEGITTGTSRTTFSPNAPCTRGQIATFLHRAAGSPTPQTSKNPFTDVKDRDYYYNAVLWAVGEGITNGTSKTTFAPSAPCTRAQIATLLYRYYK